MFWVAAHAAIMPSHTRTVIAGRLRPAGRFLYVNMQVNQTENFKTRIFTDLSDRFDSFCWKYIHHIYSLLYEIRVGIYSE